MKRGEETQALRQGMVEDRLYAFVRVEKLRLGVAGSFVILVIAGVPVGSQ